ncbi:MAG: hypothetical protein KC657_33695 [Myxococcales bacterium]|nr:hypothetical protein [Myxococcales bacterium]
MSTQSKLSRKVFSAVFASTLGIAALASPSVKTDKGASIAHPKVEYKLARADKPPPGGDKTAENIKALCSLLGVGEQFHSAAPAKCKVENLGELAPNATVCATPPPGSNELTEGAANRTCEFCVAALPTNKCKKEISVDATVKANFSLPIYGHVITCSGDISYSARAASQVDVTNSTWKSVAGATGTDEAVTYISSLTTSTVASEAAFDFKAGCKADGAVISAELSAELGIKCKLEETVTFGAKETREKRTCGEVEEPCATTEDSAPSAAKAVAHPCPVPVTDDAGAPVVEDPEPPATDTDAGAPVPVEEMPGMP